MRKNTALEPTRLMSLSILSGPIVARRVAMTTCCILLAFGLSACGRAKIENDYPDTYEGATEESGSVFDLVDFGGKSVDTLRATKAKEKDVAITRVASTNSRDSRLAVNAFLWRAALETVSFMPLASVNPSSGVIITDWYNAPKQPDDRLKINIVILGTKLRADILRVSVFREKRVGGRWVGHDSAPQTELQMENIILTRARDYKIAARDIR